MKLQVTEFPNFSEDNDDDLGPPGESWSMTLDEAVAYLNEFLDTETANPGGMVHSYEPHFCLYLWATDWDSEEKEDRKIVQFVPEDEADSEAMVKALIQPFRGLRASHYHFKPAEVHLIYTSRVKSPGTGRRYVFMVKLEGTVLYGWSVLVDGITEPGKPFIVMKFWDYSQPGWYRPDDPRFGPGLTSNELLRAQLRAKAIRTIVTACEAALEQLARS